ncbi:hypothetical protein IT415_01620 [bacterium]|nr:hypothetical protein [bacterium]
MSKVAIGVGVIILFGLGVGGYMYFRGVQPSPSQSSSSQTSTTTAVENSSMNLNSLASSGQPRECIFTTTVSNGTGEGHMYSDGKGLARLTINTTSSSGEQGESNTLLRDGKAYSWTNYSGQMMGFVMPMSSAPAPDSGTGDASTNSNNTNFNVTCKAWAVDSGKFSVPSDIQFQSLGQ